MRGQLELCIKVITEVDPSTEMQQTLKPMDGHSMSFITAAVAPFLLAKSQAI